MCYIHMVCTVSTSRILGRHKNNNYYRKTDAKSLAQRCLDLPGIAQIELADLRFTLKITGNVC